MGKFKTKISIVTVVYNAEKYIQQTVENVISLNYENIEYILIDGSSTDKTVEIIQKYNKEISYFISEPDQGIYDAMNKATKIASGEWIIFMNAGDTFYNNFVIDDFLKNVKEETEIYNGAINFINETSNTSIVKQPYGLDKVWITVPCWHQASFIKTSLMKKYMYSTHYKIAGDHDFYLKCFINNHKFQFTKDVIANMLAEGLHAQENKLAYIESLNIIAKYAPDINLIYKSDFYAHLKHNDTRKDDINNYKFSIYYNKLYEQINKITMKYNHIALYGYGTIGKTIEKITKDKISVIIDKNPIQHESIEIIKPSDLKNYKYDIILISVLGREESIKECLLKENIQESKILTINLNETAN